MLKNLTTLQKGIYLAFATALISGGANFVNKLSMSAVGQGPYQYTTLKNIVVALVLLLIVLTPKIFQRLRQINKKDWRNLVIIGIVGGSVPFLLFFKGLSMTSAVNASFIHKTLFIWVAIMAIPFLKEKLSRLQIGALGLLVVGNFIFSGFKGFVWGYAETIILVATMLWAVENIIAKITLKNVDAIVLAWARMFFGSIVLVGYLAFSNQLVGMTNFNFSQMGWILLVSVFLLSYVVTWYSALKRAPATVVTSILVIASPITTFLNSGFLTHQLSANKIWGALIIILAVSLFIYFRPKVIAQKQTAYETG
ncbi:DMT family transporter [Patescibacteria group bacterium]|nr:DMT family transporter [Patescibacteria group bacterium]